VHNDLGYLVAGKVKKYLLISALAVLVLLAAIGFGLVPINLFFAKPAISNLIAQNLGMDLEIQGPLRIRFGPAPKLTASGITLRFQEPGGRPLVHIAQLAIRPRLQDVLNGDFHLRGISATGVEIDYCQGVPHNSETIPDPLSGRGAQPSIAIDQLRIRDIRPGCSKQENLLGFLPRQLELEASAPLDGPTSVSLDGIIGDDEVVHLMLFGGSLTELLEDSENFPFELNLQVPDSGISAAGTVSTPLTDPEVEFRGELVSGHLKRMTGENSMELSAVARGFTSRPYVQVEASLQQLDLRRLLDGAEKPGEKKDPFSFRPVYEFLGRFDARVNIGVGSFLNTPLAVDELAMDASLEGGVLELTRAEFLLAGSPVSAVALLDTRGACAGLSGTVRILNFDLDQLNRFLDDGASLGGRVDQADISSSSCGDTLAEHAGSARVTIAGNGLAGSWGNERLPLSFRSVQLETSWKEAGSLSFDGELLGENLSATAVFGSIESIQSENRSPLKIDARGDASQLTLAGEAGIVKGNLDLDLDVNFDTSRFGSLHAWIGADPGNVLAMRGRTSLALGEDGLAAWPWLSNSSRTGWISMNSPPCFRRIQSHGRPIICRRQNFSHKANGWKSGSSFRQSAWISRRDE
jgi:hypothetical protein